MDRQTDRKAVTQTVTQINTVLRSLLNSCWVNSTLLPDSSPHAMLMNGGVNELDILSHLSSETLRHISKVISCYLVLKILMAGN
jgi:hypothetical protein